MLHAKAMPQGLLVPAMKFTGPSGDGRRGSAGFVVQSQNLVKGAGTRWRFVFQRDSSGYGFQVIHPFESGHILVTVHSGVTIHRGGSWGDIGWGNPATSDKVVLPAAVNTIFPLKTNVPHRIVSELLDNGDYQLLINETLIFRHTIEAAKPLSLDVPPKEPVWGGSGWDRTPFAGKEFIPQLKTGQAGLIVGPMDGSGPRQFIKDVSLASAVHRGSGEENKHFEALFTRIDNVRESGKLKRSTTVGGSGGGPFEVIPDSPSLLVGFEYTTSKLYGGHLTVKSVRPIFQSRDGEFTGKWNGLPHGKVQRVVAKPQYVVAGIVGKSGHRVDGMRLIFMRVQGGRLNPDDTYRSDWIGGQGGGPQKLCAANGDPVVGIYGRRGHDLDAIGFIQAPVD